MTTWDMRNDVPRIRTAYMQVPLHTENTGRYMLCSYPSALDHSIINIPEGVHRKTYSGVFLLNRKASVPPHSQGFDTFFTFRLSSPSLRCNSMDGVHTHCRSRGADGLAFVIQGDGSTALGKAGLVRRTPRKGTEQPWYVEARLL